MKKLDSITAVLDWINEILTELVKGIKGTFAYWNNRKDELKDLAE